MSNFAERRRATEQLAISIRAMADAAAVTAVDPSVLDDARAQIEEIAARLRAELHDGAYSGLVEQPVDFSVPEGPMPLNPIIGPCNPTRPDVQLRYADGEVVGTARFTRRFTGPPGLTHGGISAMLADQIVAASPGAIGRRAITKSLELRYLRPLPLDEEVALWGVCVPTGDDTFRARCTITARGKLAVEGRAELVSFESFYQRGSSKE